MFRIDINAATGQIDPSRASSRSQLEPLTSSDFSQRLRSLNKLLAREPVIEGQEAASRMCEERARNKSPRKEVFLTDFPGWSWSTSSRWQRDDCMPNSVNAEDFSCLVGRSLFSS